MKKSRFTKSVMMLTAGLMMASCTKGTDVFEQNQANYAEQQKTEYKSNYVAKYGQPDANQSWDFAALSTTAKTRAGETMTCSRINAYPQQFNQHVKNDRDQIKNMVASADVKPWNPYLIVELFPSLGHGVAGGDKYFELAVCYNNQHTDIFDGIKLNKNSWADKGSGSTSNLPHNSGRYIDTKSLTTAENVYWVAYNYNSKKSEVDGQLANFKIEYYKELKLNGRTYWCFDCTGDGDYSNLICMVIDADPLPIEKRYLVEDLGSKDDFDFNDIVFDVKQANDGTQKCVIRAMGGTLDFTLKIGNTEWTKSVEGVAAGYNVKTMYNTQGTIVWDKVLAEFPVTGWNFSSNNISVKVKTSVSDDVIIEIPFPKKGEVPMIIAFRTFCDWQSERESLPEDWWVIPDD
ncbi:hypothetical protein [Xylanibacter ruminicola]|uniref:hypothetical protein n=1 Tax=Xylanibacter ruminicola TaxID=839 RepID=UPI0012D2F8C2|nr:hypothetical protein [Xylanibacter ruminicola]